MLDLGAQKRSAKMIVVGLITAGIFATTAVDGTAQPDPAVEADPTTPRPPFEFPPADEALLDEIQLGCWNYFLNEVDPITLMVLDRTDTNVISVAGVGFQLTALTIADERGWLAPGLAEIMTSNILRSLRDEPSNRVRGLFYHYLEPGTAKPSQDGYEEVVSTIDTALLFAGLLTASAHFGGEIGDIADQLVAEGDWASFKLGNAVDPTIRGFISLGWEDKGDVPFEQGLLPFAWADAGDEQRLTAFLAAAAPNKAFRVPIHEYYRLRRTLGTTDNGDTIAWFPWSGALFTAFFSHCWIDYASRGADNPAAFGIANRPGIDWWENSRRTAVMHRDRSIANPAGLTGFGPFAWGLSASDGEGRYIVPGMFPQLSNGQFGQPGFDHLVLQPADNWEDGTLAPYTAGSTIVFEPQNAVFALRFYRQLAQSLAPALWDDPAAGGYGFADSFRFGPNGTVEWVASDRVAIDAGPMLIMIENARSRFVWNTFESHPYIRAVRRLNPVNRTEGQLRRGTNPAVTTEQEREPR
ncbi:MAG: glucoamylase family protein [Planctomycetota bacterium]